MEDLSQNTVSDVIDNFGSLEEYNVAKEYQDGVQDFINGYIELLHQRWGTEAVQKMIKEVKYLRDNGGMELGEALTYHYFNITKKELFS